MSTGEEMGPPGRFPIRAIAAAGIALALLAPLGWFVVVRPRNLARSRVQQAMVERDLVMLQYALAEYHGANGRHPKSLPELLSGGSRLLPNLSDPWGHWYVYELVDGKPQVSSLGPDGAPGGGDDVVRKVEDVLLAAASGALSGPAAATGRSELAEELSGYLEMLRGDDPAARAEATGRIGKLAPRAREAVPLLVERFMTGTREDRWLVAGALPELGAPAGEAAADLVAILMDALEDRDRRHAAAFALGGIGRWAAPVAVPALAAALGERERDVPLFAAEALGEIGPAAAAAVPALAEAGRAGDERLRLAAIAALRQIGPGAAAAAPFLEESLAGASEDVRAAAAQALAAIRGEAGQPPQPK